MAPQEIEPAGPYVDGAMTTRLRIRTAAAVAISALLLTAGGQDPEEEPPALGGNGAGDDSAAAELPAVSAGSCLVFEECEDSFPGNTEGAPEAAAAWMDEQSDAGDEKYTAQLKAPAQAIRAYGEGHKPLTALEGQMRGLHEHCTHGG